MDDGASPLVGTSPRTSLAERVDLLAHAGETTETSAGFGDLVRLGASVIAAFANSSLMMLLAWILLPALVLGWKPTAVSSGSMEPAIERGDVVLMRPPPSEPLSPDTVVRFPDLKGGGSIVHRIVSVDTEIQSYVTKGDASDTNDTTPIAFGEVDGVGTMLVPIIGHPMLWYAEGRVLPLAGMAIGLASALIAGAASARTEETEPLSSTWSDPITAQTIGDVGAPHAPLLTGPVGLSTVPSRGSPQ